MTSATTPLVDAKQGARKSERARHRVLPASAWWIICSCLAFLFVVHSFSRATASRSGTKITKATKATKQY